MKLSELKKIADSATPGPWEFHPGATGEYPMVFKRGLFPGDIVPLPKDADDMKFIEVFNPSTAIKLIGILEDAKEIIMNSYECACNRDSDNEMYRWLENIKNFENANQ